MIYTFRQNAIYAYNFEFFSFSWEIYDETDQQAVFQFNVPQASVDSEKYLARWVDSDNKLNQFEKGMDFGSLSVADKARAMLIQISFDSIPDFQRELLQAQRKNSTREIWRESRPGEAIERFDSLETEMELKNAMHACFQALIGEIGTDSGYS